MRLPRAGVVLAVQVLAASSLAAQRHIGELSLAAGFAQAEAGLLTGGSYAGTTSLAFVRGRLSLGPEGGYYHFGGTERATMLGGVVRLAILARRAQVYAVAGLAQGAYRGPVDINLFSGSAGVGAAWPLPGTSLALSLEGRWHRSLQHSGGAGHPAFLVLQTGGRLRW